jgi:hypothetical protein
MNGFPTRFPTICVATGICLFIAAVDVANPKGTFRLQGPWPAPSTQTSSTQIMNGLAERCRHKLLHHVLLRDHQDQVCI